jgi:hypothetical protein
VEDISGGLSVTDLPSLDQRSKKGSTMGLLDRFAVSASAKAPDENQKSGRSKRALSARLRHPL